jgi:DNA ligase-1
MNFLTIARGCKTIEAESSRTAITAHLAELFAPCSADEARFLSAFFMGVLAPSYQNFTINMADKSVAKAAASFLGVSYDHCLAAIKSCGDVGLFIEKEMIDRGMEPAKEQSVLWVRDQLFALARLSGEGSQEGKEQMLGSVLAHLSPLEACYVVRCITGALRLGFSDMTMLDAFSVMEQGDKKLRPVLEQCYNVRADLGEVVALLKSEGLEAVRAAEIVPGIPVRPAAAERLADADAIVEKLGSCVVQPKLDGFRVQVHVWTDDEGVRQTRFFSRNLRDMSEMFPELASACQHVGTDSVVFEGEAIVHDPITGQFLPFQETVKRKRKHGVAQAAEELPLTLYVFDVLYSDGKSLFDLSHEKRRSIAFAITQPIPEGHGVFVIGEDAVETGAELSLIFEDAMSKGLEGVVVKKPSAHYQPGKRNFNWIKLKRQERGELADTLDCVILGYYAGAGKRASFGIGAFLVGVFNPAHDAFETIAKIGTGLSDDEWRALKLACDTHAVHDQPHNVRCDKSLVPDVWVHPHTVCMVRADDITRSPVHAAGKTAQTPGYALRFPRIMGYRPDKEALQATTVKEVARLYELQDLKVR